MMITELVIIIGLADRATITATKIDEALAVEGAEHENARIASR